MRHFVCVFLPSTNQTNRKATHHFLDVQRRKWVHSGGKQNVLRSLGNHEGLCGRRIGQLRTKLISCSGQLLQAPLLLSADLPNLDSAIIDDIVGNEEVIAINQDPLGIQVQ